MTRIWYPGRQPRRVGIRLEPGWNEIPDSSARRLLERGIVLAKPSSKDQQKDTEEAVARLTPVFDVEVAEHDPLIVRDSDDEQEEE